MLTVQEWAMGADARPRSTTPAAAGDLAARVADANASFVDSLKTLVQHVDGAEWRDVGGVFAFATGLPIPLFNGCIAVADVHAEDLAAAVAWVRGRPAPFGVWIDERAAPDACAGAERAGLDRRPDPYPAMALCPIPAPPPLPSGLTVRPVEGAGLEAYYAIREAAGAPPALARRAVPASLAGDPRVRLFIAESDGVPVGNAMAIRTGNVLGVYGVGTLPAARKRGVGTAATWACLEAGRTWGCDVAVQIGRAHV